MLKKELLETGAAGTKDWLDKIGLGPSRVARNQEQASLDLNALVRLWGSNHASSSWRRYSSREYFQDG
jgi:hypothetical protein